MVKRLRRHIRRYGLSAKTLCALKRIAKELLKGRYENPCSDVQPPKGVVRVNRKRQHVQQNVQNRADHRVFDDRKAGYIRAYPYREEGDNRCEANYQEQGITRRGRGAPGQIFR